MKKTILVVLMVLMIATPCIAQEIEPEGMFSIEGTLWTTCGIPFFTTPPFVWLPKCYNMGFYEGAVYGLSDNASSIDLLVASIVTDSYTSESGDWDIFLGIMKPIGIGVFTMLLYTPESMSPLNPHPATFIYVIGIMFKIDDDWKPPPEIE